MKNYIKSITLMLIVIFSVNSYGNNDKKEPKFSEHKIILKKYPNNTLKANNSLKNTKQFKTVLKGYLQGQPNYAGKYIIATWGCGSSCLRHAIINKNTGYVFWPEEIYVTFNLFKCDKNTLEFREDSNLLILNTPDLHGKVIQKFYLWKNEKFTSIKTALIKDEMFCKNKIDSDF